MIESLAKNIWLSLTILMPGFFTYGTFRIFQLFAPGNASTCAVLQQIDSSAITSASVIVAIALLQQSIAITIEFILASVSCRKEKKWPNFHFLFCQRFQYEAKEKLNQNEIRIIGNFFLSLNMCIGLMLLFLYFVIYEGMYIGQLIPFVLILLFIAAFLSTIFRLKNAKKVHENKYTIMICFNKEDVCKSGRYWYPFVTFGNKM